MLSHVVVINMTYTDNDPMFDIRLDWFKNEVLPRLLKQTDPNFDIAIKCNPNHADKVRAVHTRLIVCWENNMSSGKGDVVFVNDAKEKVRKFSKWKDIIGLDKYDIQTNLDSDDFVSENHIARIKEEVLKNLAEPLHIQFQPEVIHTKTNKIKKSKVKYSSVKGSAFYSIYQPDKANYIFVRDDSHIRMPKRFKKTVLIPEGYCWIVCNENNYRTTFKGL